jgi:hypothetical protein
MIVDAWASRGHGMPCPYEMPAEARSYWVILPSGVMM